MNIRTLVSFFPFTLGLFSSVAQSINVEIVNQSTVLPGNIYVLVAGDNSKPITLTGITAGTPVLLSNITNQTFGVSAISSGRIYISYNNSVTSNEPPTSQTRYDKVELTYPGAANLTAVDFFGIPFRVDTLDASSNIIQTLNYYASGNTLQSTLSTLAPGAVVTTTGLPGGPFARVLSPTGSPSSYSSMQPYVTSVSGKTVTITGTYVGSVGPTPNTYTYSGTFASDGTISLTGTMSQAATPANAPLQITGSSLSDAIYTDNGPYTVNGVASQVSDNDVYAAIYANLIGAFDFGYVNGKYRSSSAGWYGTTPYHPPYAAARSSADGYFNQYASAIAAASDAYGFPFTDLNQPVQVALNPGTSTDVVTLRITILPDDLLDAPIIQTATPSSNSIALTWGAVTGATSYSLGVSPPPVGPAPTPTSQTSATIQNLSPGTPYTISLTATNGSGSSAALPIVITTTGSVTPVTGNVTWNFIPNFTGTFTGDTITFNGVAQTIPAGANQALQFNNVPAQSGQQNAYVFTWKDATGKLIYNSILYVDMAASPTSGMGTINQSPAETYLASNLTPPTYAVGVAFNLFLSIQPLIQRTITAEASPSPTPTPDASPPSFGPPNSITTRLINGGRKVRVTGAVRDADGIGSVSVQVPVKGKGKKTFGATFHGGHWQAKLPTQSLRKHFKLIVIVVDRQGHQTSRTYKIDR